jgi:hypothetical protein
LCLFFSLTFFSLSPSLNPNFFFGTRTYPSNLPTTLSPPNPSTFPYLPHHSFSLPSITRASKPMRTWLVGFRVCTSKAWREELEELGEWRGSSSNSRSLHNIKRSWALKVSVFFSCFLFLLLEPGWQGAAGRPRFSSLQLHLKPRQFFVMLQALKPQWRTTLIVCKPLNLKLMFHAIP